MYDAAFESNQFAYDEIEAKEQEEIYRKKAESSRMFQARMLAKPSKTADGQTLPTLLAMPDPQYDVPCLAATNHNVVSSLHLVAVCDSDSEAIFMPHGAAADNVSMKQRFKFSLDELHSARPYFRVRWLRGKWSQAGSINVATHAIEGSPWNSSGQNIC